MTAETFPYRNRAGLGVAQIAMGLVTAAKSTVHLVVTGKPLTSLPPVVDKTLIVVLLASGVALALMGLRNVVRGLRPGAGVRLLADRLVLPRGLMQADTEIPYASIREVDVTTLLGDKELNLKSEKGSISIQDYLFKDKAVLQELADAVAERVAANGAGATGQLAHA